MKNQLPHRRCAMTTGANVPRRGRVSGLLLMLLGAWGALIPFVGPYFGYAYTPDKAWAYNSGRLWLSVAPGAAVFLGGLLATVSARAAQVGAFLAALGGAWFVLGQLLTAGGRTDCSRPPRSQGSVAAAALDPAASLHH